MATIIQFPNSINFLENLKAVRIASSETVAFKLSSGGSTILEETYSPGPSGIVEVELRDVISEYLAIAYPSSDVFNQASAIAQMTVNVDDDEDQDFTVLSGGVRGLSTTDESFLRANWLTWQPQTKTVRWNQPEYLTFAHLSAGTVKAKFYTKAGGSETVTLHSASAGQVNTYRMQMSTLFAASSYEPEGLYGLVDVWVENGGVQQSYVQRYVCTPETRDEHYFSCVNSLGGIDTFCFTGPQILAPSVEHATALRGDRKIDITPAPERSWTQNTGDLDKAESKWIWDFFNSSRHWAAIDGELEEIVIESSSVRASDAENLNAFDFAFSPVNTGRTMKIDRTSGQLPAMQVLSPTGDLFFLAPRIVDYPDATIDESLLLLTQSPLVQEWRKIGIGPLCDYLSDQIHNTSWGQLAHTHSNKAVIDALSEQGGKLLFNGQPVTPDIPQMPDHYIAGTKAKTAESDDALSRVTKISFTAATAASESVDLEVVTINGQRFLHTSLPFFSDSEITAGGVGSGETPGPATTLGALLNVDSEADDTPTTDKILVREAGSTHWTITDLADISGSVTGVRMNGSLMPISNKVVDLGSVVTSLTGYRTASAQDVIDDALAARLGDTTAQNVAADKAFVSQNYLAATLKGSASGLAELDANGKVPSAQLPSYVDDVLEYASMSAFPATGESGKIYVALDTNKTYRWSGSGYVEISESLALGETASTAYRGDRGKIAYDHSQITSGNPHGTTKSDIGLSNVENTKLSTWSGSANITTLGTIISGTWHGNPIDDGHIASSSKWNNAKTDIDALKILFGTMFELDTTSVPGKSLIKANLDLYSYHEITAGGIGTSSATAGGIPEAPIDNHVYGRNNSSWVNLDTRFDEMAGALQPTLTYILFERGWISSSDGQNSPLNPNYSRTDYIPISANPVESFAGLPTGLIYGKRFYDSTKRFLGTGYSSSAAYVRYTYDNVSINNISVTVNGVTYYSDKYKKTASDEDVRGLIDLVPTINDNAVKTAHVICDTAANVINKTLDLPGFVLRQNVRIVVKFNNANNLPNATLNINNTGAIPLYNLASGGFDVMWKAGERLDIIYNGAQYLVSTYGLFDQVTLNRLKANTAYVWCETAGNVSQKEVNLPIFNPFGGYYELRPIIRFRHANTAANVTLKIGDYAAFPMYYNGEPVSPSNTWEDLERVEIFNNENSQYFARSYSMTLQTPGQSRKDVMSQKAVTDLIDARTVTIVSSNNALPSPAGHNLCLVTKPGNGLIWSDGYVWRNTSDNKAYNTAEKYLAFKLTNENVFVSKNDEQVTDIASITKLISALVIVSYVQNWTTTITIISSDVYESRDNFVAVGDTVTYDDMLHAMLILSDNNASEAMKRPIGYLINPSAQNDNEARQAFLNRMETICAEIGLENTSNFVTAASEVKSTARDICKLLKYINNNVPKIKSIWGLLSYNMQVIRNGAIYTYTIDSTVSQATRNNIIPEFVGGKTGTITKSALACIWKNANNNELYSLVLLDSPLDDNRFQNARQIINEIYSDEHF